MILDVQAHSVFPVNPFITRGLWHRKVNDQTINPQPSTILVSCRPPPRTVLFGVARTSPVLQSVKAITLKLARLKVWSCSLIFLLVKTCFFSQILVQCLVLSFALVFVPPLEPLLGSLKLFKLPMHMTCHASPTDRLECVRRMLWWEGGKNENPMDTVQIYFSCTKNYGFTVKAWRPLLL